MDINGSITAVVAIITAGTKNAITTIGSIAIIAIGGDSNQSTAQGRLSGRPLGGTFTVLAEPLTCPVSSGPRFVESARHTGFTARPANRGQAEARQRNGPSVGDTEAVISSDAKGLN